MTDSKYSEALLDEKFNTIADKMDTHFDAHTEILKDIKEQTTKTNGRVSSLEWWRSWITGGMAVMTLIVIPILIGVMAWLIHQVLLIPEQIDAAFAENVSD